MYNVGGGYFPMHYEIYSLWYCVTFVTLWQMVVSQIVCHSWWVVLHVQGGTGPRIPDRGVVGRSGRQASKKKIGPPQKSWSNRQVYHLQSKYEIYMCNISLSDSKNGEYSHIFNDSSPWVLNSSIQHWLAKLWLCNTYFIIVFGEREWLLNYTSTHLFACSTQKLGLWDTLISFGVEVPRVMMSYYHIYRCAWLRR